MSKFDLEAYIKSEQKEVPLINYKPQEFINMPKAFQDAIGLPGFPVGSASFLYGLSDCGKTAILLAAAKAAQEQGHLVFLILSENKTDKKRLIDAGLDLDKLVRKEDLQFLEDVYDFISVKIHEIKSGQLPLNVTFVWDSLTASVSKDSIEFTKEGKIIKKFTNQKNANVIGFYNPIIAKLIAETREESCKGTATLLTIAQAYVKPPEFSGGIATTVPNGGEKIYFPMSLGIEVKEGRRLKATFKGREVEHSLVTRLKVRKNHLTNLNCEGEVVFMGTEMLPNDKVTIDKFKDENKEKWIALLENKLEE
jgi:hypothetical protein